MTPWTEMLAAFRPMQGVSMASKTTFRCESRAACWIEIRSVEDLRSLAKILLGSGAMFRRDWDVVGNGSNLLIADQGYQGILVHLDPEGFSWIREIEAKDSEVRVEVGAATMNGKLLQWTREKKLGGFEFSFGIPGTVGGGVRMNAGTPKGWFAKCVHSVTMMDAQGEVSTMVVHPEDFEYRNFPPAKDRVVLSCEMIFSRSEPLSIEAKIEEAKRGRAQQPLEWPNFGSVFRNPPGDFAGRLIEAAGLKGKTVGAAKISEKHANFIVNLGGAKTQDALALIEEARRAVSEKFNVSLTREVVVLGEA